MAKGSRSISKLQDQLKNARSRALRLSAGDPVQQLGMGAVGGAIIALMNNNNLKLPIPGVPASLQVGVTALVISKALKPRGLLGKLWNQRSQLPALSSVMDSPPSSAPVAIPRTSCSAPMNSLSLAKANRKISTISAGNLLT